MGEVRSLVSQRESWISCFDMRPNSLFEGVAQRLCIVVSANSNKRPVPVFTGGYRRWTSEERTSLVQNTIYIARHSTNPDSDLISKFSTDLEQKILSKISGVSLGHWWAESASPIFIHRIVRYFVKALDFVPLFIDSRGKRGKSEDYKEFRFVAPEQKAITALLNSSLFYWFWRSHSDGFHCGYGDVFLMPYKMPMQIKVKESLHRLHEQLMARLREESREKTISTKQGTIRYQEFYPKTAKPVIDEIDRMLAKHYGFTDEELDFIINYDIKYRMGRDAGEEGE
jgi:hypothetical protein